MLSIIAERCVHGKVSTRSCRSHYFRCVCPLWFGENRPGKIIQGSVLPCVLYCSLLLLLLLPLYVRHLRATHPPTASRPVHTAIQRRTVPALSSARDRSRSPPSLPPATGLTRPASSNSVSIEAYDSVAAAAAVQLLTNYDYCSLDYPFNHNKHLNQKHYEHFYC